MSLLVDLAKKTKPCCSEKKEQESSSQSKKRKYGILFLKLLVCCSIPVAAYIILYLIFSWFGYSIPKPIMYIIILFCPVTHLIILFDTFYKKKRASKK